MDLLKLFSIGSLVLAPITSAHFTVTIPPPLGTNLDNEATSPCGGYTPSSSDTLVNFHVGGDAVAFDTLHAQSFFAFRGTLGDSLSSANWTALIPTVEEFGLGAFCEPTVPVPEEWAGSSGLLQVIQDSEDGVHYACMHVNFVTGVGTANSACTNASGVSAQYASDPNLPAVGNQPQPTMSGTSTSSPTTQTTSASSSSTQPPPTPSKSIASLTASQGVLTKGFLLAIFVAFMALV